MFEYFQFDHKALVNLGRSNLTTSSASMESTEKEGGKMGKVELVSDNGRDNPTPLQATKRCPESLN